MSVLVLLWVGTLGVIYASSYFEMTKQNKQMLMTHAQMYSLPQESSNFSPERPSPDGFHSFKPDFDPQSPKFRLSTFYSVAIDYDGKVLETKNEPPVLHSDQDLESIASSVIKDGKNYGAKNNLTFYTLDKGGYNLVAFMDNTVINEGAVTLLRFTLIFGALALVLFFFLSVLLARKIVDPLEKSYQKQKQFISDAGHELKTPVSVVSANAELLAREIGDNKWLSNIQYENERMTKLVTELLDLARNENAPIASQRLNLSRLVAGEVLPFESVAFEKNLTLISDIEENVFVVGDMDRLGQIVSILLDNAIEHTKDGEIKIVLTKEHGFAKLSVTNKGEEIPNSHRERIFERFYRVDSARSGEGNHYGLGLAIAKAIVTAHKGSICVNCKCGTVEFAATFPSV